MVKIIRLMFSVILVFALLGGGVTLTYADTSRALDFSSSLGGDSGSKDSLGTVYITLNAPEEPVEYDTQFAVYIDVESGEQNIAAIDAVMDFDPDYLEVISLTLNTSAFPSELYNYYNNTNGKIILSGGNLNLINGSFTMGTIVFEAKAVTAATDITFDTTPPTYTVAAYQAQSLPLILTDAEVTIFSLTPTVRATLQGTRPYPSGYQVPLTIRVYDSGLTLNYSNILTASYLYEYTSENGDIEITDIDEETKTIYFTVDWTCEDGTYHIALLDPHVPHSPPYAHSLINLMNDVTIDPSQSEIDMGELVEGNPNADVIINGGDYNIVINDYLSTPGGGNWNDGRSDFNHTNQVTSMDLSFVVYNYYQYSPIVVGEEKMGGEPEAYGKVALSLSTQDAVKSLTEGKTFSADIEVNTGTQPVDAIDAFLSFDPDSLEVLDITPGKTLGVVLVNGFDNKKGTIDLSLCRDLKADSATGTFSLGTIQFKVRQGSGTTIAFEQKSPRNTEVAYHGESLLGSVAGLDVKILP